MSDIDEDLLLKVTNVLKNSGGDIIPVVCDVISLEEVRNLAKQTLNVFGKLILLFNNARVIPGTNVLKNIIKDSQWVIGSNFWEAIYGVNTSLPIMFDQPEESHIVNTSSGSAFSSGNGAYDTTKYGVTALSELMRIELKKIDSNISFSLLVPGILYTAIVDSERNRSQHLKNPVRVK